MRCSPFAIRRALSPLALLLVAALLAAQATALAHEYDHALAQHDAPCALHLYAEHFGKAPPASAPAAPAAAAAAPIFVQAVAALTHGRCTSVRARAPPPLSLS